MALHCREAAWQCDCACLLSCHGSLIVQMKDVLLVLLIRCLNCLKTTFALWDYCRGFILVIYKLRVFYHLFIEYKPIFKIYFPVIVFRSQFPLYKDRATSVDLQSTFGITCVNRDKNPNVHINNSFVDSVLITQPLILPSITVVCEVWFCINKSQGSTVLCHYGNGFWFEAFRHFCLVSGSEHHHMQKHRALSFAELGREILRLTWEKQAVSAFSCLYIWNEACLERKKLQNSQEVRNWDRRCRWPVSEHVHVLV